MRHILGILGVMAAAVLLAVSAAINWRFGYSLGTNDFDGQIYGAASAAADCLKALVPFFFFAAIRNRMWSQAAASAVVWCVVTGYSLTSALGHTAHSRFEGAGQRTVAAETYADLRAALKRAQDELAAVPQHRPAGTIESEIESAKTERAWSYTAGCTDITGRLGREFCQRFHALEAEHASALGAAALEARIAEIQAKIAQANGTTAVADPQAKVLSDLTGISVEKIEMAMAIFVAVLLEIGSGFGMYVAFSQWRLYDTYAPLAARPPVEVPSQAEVKSAEEHGAATASAPEQIPDIQPAAGTAAVEPTTRAEIRPAAPAKPIVPPSDVQNYYRERTEGRPGKTVTTADMFNDYRAWCSERKRQPLGFKPFTDELEALGVKKERVGRQFHFTGISLKTAAQAESSAKILKLPTAA